MWRFGVERQVFPYWHLWASTQSLHQEALSVTWTATFYNVPIPAYVRFRGARGIVRHWPMRCGTWILGFWLIPGKNHRVGRLTQWRLPIVLSDLSYLCPLHGRRPSLGLSLSQYGLSHTHRQTDTHKHTHTHRRCLCKSRVVTRSLPETLHRTRVRPPLGGQSTRTHASVLAKAGKRLVSRNRPLPISAPLPAALRCAASSGQLVA